MRTRPSGQGGSWAGLNIQAVPVEGWGILSISTKGQHPVPLNRETDKMCFEKTDTATTNSNKTPLSFLALPIVLFPFFFPFPFHQCLTLLRLRARNDA